MGRRTWIKIFSEKWLRGSIRQEKPELRGIWMDLLALAADSAYGDFGLIAITPTMGFSDNQIAKMLNLPRQLWVATKGRLVKTDRISIGKDNEITIINWKKYQSDYARQKPYRKKVTTKGYNGKLQPKVTVEKEKEKEIKNNTTNIDKLMVKYQKKFPEVRKLFGLAGIIRAREYFDGCHDIGWTYNDILGAIEKAEISQPWKIITLDDKKSKAYAKEWEKMVKEGKDERNKV